jgi:hypothetical protein
LSISEVFQSSHQEDFEETAAELEGGGEETQRNSEIICESHMLLENAIASGDSENSEDSVSS